MTAHPTTEQLLSEAAVYDLPLPPTEIGQRVRTQSYGGEVRLWMELGTIVRFNRSGYPVVRTDNCSSSPPRDVTDRWGCFRRIDTGGRWLRPSSTPKDPAATDSDTPPDPQP